MKTRHSHATAGASDRSANKKKRRPARLVKATKKVAKKQQEIYDTNASDSPLLRLPAEVRNRIWRFALGGNMVHVYPSRKVGTCKEAFDDEEDAVRLQTSTATKIVKSHTSRHRHCTTQNFTKAAKTTLALDLLRTCRQIHQEAALLPFKCNLFSLRSVGDLDRFIGALVTMQAQAVERISLVLPASIFHTPASFRTQTLDKLTGLKALTAFIEFEYNLDVRLFVNEERYRDAMGETIASFAKSPITSAHVAVCDTEYFQSRRAPYELVPAPLAAKWTKRVEGLLTMSVDEKQAMAAERLERLEEETMQKEDEEI